MTAPAPQTARPPLTDSAWYWVALFAWFGLAALLAVTSLNRYRDRRERLDLQFVARQEVYRRQLTPDANESNANESNAAQPFASADAEAAAPDTSLVPVGVLLAGAAIGSTAVLVRERRRAPAASESLFSPPPP